MPKENIAEPEAARSSIETQERVAFYQSYKPKIDDFINRMHEGYSRIGVGDRVSPVIEINETDGYIYFYNSNLGGKLLKSGFHIQSFWANMDAKERRGFGYNRHMDLVDPIPTHEIEAYSKNTFFDHDGSNGRIDILQPDFLLKIGVGVDAVAAVAWSLAASIVTCRAATQLPGQFAQELATMLEKTNAKLPQHMRVQPAGPKGQ